MGTTSRVGCTREKKNRESILDLIKGVGIIGSKVITKGTSTKLFVMRCWYLSRTFESFTSLITVASSTKISQPWAAHAIVCPTPSSIILVVRYPPQHWVQKRCPHSNPVISWRKNTSGEYSSIELFTTVTKNNIFALTLDGSTIKQISHSSVPDWEDFLGGWKMTNVVQSSVQEKLILG